MSSGKCAWIVVFSTALTAASQPVHPRARTSLSCDRATMSRPQAGAAYRGNVSIDDYKLQARVPEGLTGWSGVATDAPFHGFTIFLDPKMRSCIVFEIHLRIDDDEAPVQPRTARRMLLGNATAWQISNGNHAQNPINITTYFSSRRDGQVDDGKVSLISPPEQFHEAKSIYDAFLNSMMLGTR